MNAGDFISTAAPLLCFVVYIFFGLFLFSIAGVVVGIILVVIQHRLTAGFLVAVGSFLPVPYAYIWKAAPMWEMSDAMTLVVLGGLLTTVFVAPGVGLLQLLNSNKRIAHAHS